MDDLDVSPEFTREVTRAANDGVVEVADGHPDLFLAVGMVSLSDLKFAVEETIRCTRDLKLLGIQIVSNVNGDPIYLEKFDPFYAILERHDVTLWIPEF